MNNKWLGGLDPSSKKIAIVVSEREHQDFPHIFIHEIASEDHQDRCAEAFDFVFEVCMKFKDEGFIIYMEEPVMGVGGPGATIPQAYVEGAIMTAADQAGIKVRIVNNSTWKKRVLGNGNIPKVEIGPKLVEIWPKLYKAVPLATSGDFKGKPDQDALDAGCLNKFGWKQILLAERLRKRRENA